MRFRVSPFALLVPGKHGCVGPGRETARFHRVRALIVLSGSVAVLAWLKGWAWALVVGAVLAAWGLTNELLWRRGEEPIGGFNWPWRRASR